MQTSAVCWEGTTFNQTHHPGEEGPTAVLPIPDDIWGSARRDRVHDTYKDVFRSAGAMIGDFIDAVRDGRPCEPDFEEGARVQRLLALAGESAALDGRLLPIGW